MFSLRDWCMTSFTVKTFHKSIINHALAGHPIEPRCPHTRECGGCAFQDRAYADQVAAKVAVLRELYAASGIVLTEMTVVPSPDPFGYRTRWIMWRRKDVSGYVHVVGSITLLS